MYRLTIPSLATALNAAVAVQSVVIGAFFGWQAVQTLPGSPSAVWGGWIILACALSSLCMFLLYRGRLGHPGLRGLWVSMVVQTYMTVFGSLMAGTVSLPGLGTLYGPIFAAKASLGSVQSVMVVVSQMVLCHYAMVPWQRARTDAIVVNRPVRSIWPGRRAKRSPAKGTSPVVGAT